MIDQKWQAEQLLGMRRNWKPIALWLAPGGGPYGPMLLELARQRRWQLIDVNSLDGYPPPNIDVRGALVEHLPTTPPVQAMQDRGIPIVRLGKWPHPDDEQVPAVIPDQPAAGRLAAEHFAERDFRHLACVGHEPWGHNETIYDAFASRGRELGCTCDLLQEHTISQEELGSPQARLAYRQQQFVDWVENLPRPVGLLAFSDRQADRFAQWIAGAGLAIPQDVAVLGIGDDRMVCECAIRPLSSIALDTRGIATTAVTTLEELIDGKAVASTCIRIPPAAVITRQTSDVVASSNLYVAEALRFMWDHITEDLSVDQIAEQVGVSRRTLEVSFQRDLGRGINAEFQRRRLEKGRDLLLETNWQVAHVAEFLGFSSPKYFAKAFHKAYGASPVKYRANAESS